MSMRRVGRADIASEGLFAGCHVPLRVAAAKRGVDVVVAAVGLAATAPVWLLGRRLVGELRVGRVLAERTEVFRLYRFAGDGLFAGVPQLLNLLLGQVSLVGPRVEAPAVYDRMERAQPFLADRLMGLRPGLVGLGEAAEPIGRVWRDGEYGRALGGLGCWLWRDAAALGQAARRAWSRSA